MSAYDTAFFSGHHAGSLGSARAVVPMLRELVAFSSVIDLGCGTGTWLSAFAESGTTDYLGLDGSWVDQAALAIPRERFRVADLAAPPPLERRFDLALSVEVAEHLPEASADAFVRTLASLAPVVAFSAAIPGQGGTHHVNEQWPDYWASRFLSRGYLCIDCLRTQLWARPDVQWWYSQNLLIFADKNVIGAHAGLSAATGLTPPDAPPLRLVHPGCFDTLRQTPLGVSRIVKEGPGALRRAAGRVLRPRGSA